MMQAKSVGNWRASILSKGSSSYLATVDCCSRDCGPSGTVLLKFSGEARNPDFYVKPLDF